jgi:chromate transporter
VSTQPATGDRPAGAPLTTLPVVLREWGRIGCTGFGGPPAHIALLRKLCVERQGWLDPAEFEEAIAASSLLPGPASTQLAIFCAWRVRGRAGALAGGAAFIIPGLILILALSALFLASSPPRWVLGAGAGAGSAVAAVALQAGWSLVRPSWKRACAGPPAGRARQARWAGYLLAGGVAAATIGSWLVLVLLGCGLAELGIREPRDGPGPGAPAAGPVPGPQGVLAAPVAASAVKTAAGATVGGAVFGAIAWVALKVGALSFGGGFVIIPLMQADAVGRHWLTSAQFLNVVALGQVTPGPVVQTVAAVGYGAAGIPGGLLAAAVAFTPSFLFILGGARHFQAIRGNPRAQAFLDGAGPAAVGAIGGSAYLLARALSQPWQYAILAAACLLLFVARRGVVTTLLFAGAAGLIIVVAGGPA